MVRVSLKPLSGKRTYTANIIGSVVFAGFCLLAIWYGPFTLRTQLQSGALLIVGVLGCWFFWQGQECGRWSVRFWLTPTIVSLVGSLVALWIGSLVYHVSFLGLLTLDKAAWGSLGQVAPFVIGPVALVLGVASMIRKTIANVFDR
jgi:hypothetical protein